MGHIGVLVRDWRYTRYAGEKIVGKANLTAISSHAGTGDLATSLHDRLWNLFPDQIKAFEARCSFSRLENACLYVSSDTKVACNVSSELVFLLG